MREQTNGIATPAGQTCAFLQFEEIFMFPAHTVHILLMCDALAECGVATTLFMYPPSSTQPPEGTELRQSYGLRRPTDVCWVRRDSNKWVTRLRQLLIAAKVGGRSTYVYTTRGLPALGALLGGCRHVIHEIHQPPAEGFWSKHDRLAFWFARRSARLHVVCISQQLAGVVAQLTGMDESTIIVEHSGHNFEIRDDYRAVASAERRPRALYVGSFDPGKGVETVFAVAAMCPTIDFAVVGGGPPLAELPPNVVVEPRVPHQWVPELLSGADILLMPFASGTRFTRDGTGRGSAQGQEEYYSPLKMVEYLSAGRAIVSSKLPSIAEVLVDGVNSLLVDPPDSVEAWATVLNRLANDRELRERLAHGAARTAEQHTVVKRARRILDAIGVGR